MDFPYLNFAFHNFVFSVTRAGAGWLLAGLATRKSLVYPASGLKNRQHMAALRRAGHLQCLENELKLSTPGQIITPSLDNAVSDLFIQLLP